MAEKTTIVKKPLLVLMVLIAVLIVLPLVSRGHRKPRATPSLGRGVANEAITLWSQGRTEEALSLLLEGKRPSSTPVTPLACLSISEAQFTQLSEAERSRVAQEYQRAAQTARDLSKAAIARIQRVQEDPARAALWTSRLKDFAGQLAGPDYCLILQLVGQAIQEVVAQELGQESRS